jgi:hypothetical protein
MSKNILGGFNGLTLTGFGAICSLIVIQGSAFAFEGFDPKVIYGDDNRMDLYQVSQLATEDPTGTAERFLKLADSTVGLFPLRSVNHSTLTGVAQLTTSAYSEEYRLCKEEPFFEQQMGAFCSGTLVGSDLILTAGHCIQNMSDCGQTLFVFGFGIKELGKDYTAVASSEVYSCKEIVARAYENMGKDFALIRLNQPVKNHLPIAINRSKETIAEKTALVLIGHPSGLPTKIAAGASVRDNSPQGYFVANTDSYGGNSGSGVFNVETGLIEGILVRGETDYKPTSAGCVVSYRCSDDSCRGEDVTKISQVAAFIPEL